ncbi:MAG: peptide chain release factor N(5)-glutamine methyltransferase [Cryomorphaceae bacterium]|nr:peptide chain release factor N(5)-glutamine methyltransferase [Cryomorphaceae bacterium]
MIPYFIKQLNGIVQEREIISLAYISIDFLLGYNRSDCIIHSDKDITSEVSDRIKQIIVDLKTNKPIQHIIGEAEFYELKFNVNEHTLIPRPETEELVKWILEHEFSSALDIGTGSGCIAIALRKNIGAEISAIDVSESALLVAKENAKINEVEINFLLQDILKTTALPKADVIVSNPPYVLDMEKEIMLDNVLNNEPHLALFVPDNNPLLFYKKIAELAFTSLSKNGLLFFEINERFGKQTVAMLNAIGFVDIELKKDINDKDRMIKATKN